MITVTLSEVEREVLCEALAQFDAPPEVHEIVAQLGDKVMPFKILGRYPLELVH